MKFDANMFRQIGDTIRAVAAAQSSRLFKSENNSLERSAIVIGAILDEINLALYDLGLTIQQINEIDPTDEVVEAMKRDGYEFGGPNPTVIVRREINVEKAGDQNGPFARTAEFIAVPEKIQRN